MRTALAWFAALAATGCLGGGVDCAQPCSRASSSEQCAIQVPGMTQEDLRGQCIAQCRQAAARGGELDGYNPDDRESVDRSRPFLLENRAQVVAWRECVLQTACEDLNDGFCPGGGIN